MIFGLLQIKIQGIKLHHALTFTMFIKLEWIKVPSDVILVLKTSCDIFANFVFQPNISYVTLYYLSL